MRDINRESTNAGLVDASALLARLDILVDNAAAFLWLAVKEPPAKVRAESEAWEQCGGTSARQSSVQRSQTWSVLTQEDERVKKSLMRSKRTSDRTPAASTIVSRLTDRTRRRQRDTLQAKGACQHVATIEDLCDTHVSRKVALSLGRMSGESVLALHNSVGVVTISHNVFGVFRFARFCVHCFACHSGVLIT